MVADALRGLWHLFCFARHGQRLLDQLDPLLQDPALLEARLVDEAAAALIRHRKELAAAPGGEPACVGCAPAASVVRCSFDVVTPAKIVEKYNRAYDEVAVALSALLPKERPFTSTLLMHIALRFVLVAMALAAGIAAEVAAEAAHGAVVHPAAPAPVQASSNRSVAAVLLLSLVQFVVSPFSLAVSVHMWFALSTAVFLPHLIIHGALFPAIQTWILVPILEDFGWRPFHEHRRRALDFGFDFFGSVTNSAEETTFVFSRVADALLTPVAPTMQFVLLFVIADLLLCAFLQCWIPGVPHPKHLRLRQLLASFGFGFVNCKTFLLVLLPMLVVAAAPTTSSGVQGIGFAIVPLWWVLDAALGLTRRVSFFLMSCGASLPPLGPAWRRDGGKTRRSLLRLIAAPILRRLSRHWAILFYHQHRIAHLPRVYSQAHKFHHFLQGSTAFDAHLYGSGLPEEWLVLVIELVSCCCFGILPATLNPHVMYLSYTNKVGHVDKQCAAAAHDSWKNAHAEHHLRHNKNFGIFLQALDLLMGTHSTSNGSCALPHNFTAQRLVCDGVMPSQPQLRSSERSVVLRFTCTMKYELSPLALRAQRMLLEAQRASSQRSDE